jgi:hypothetical protein
MESNLWVLLPTKNFAHPERGTDKRLRKCAGGCQEGEAKGQNKEQK